MAQVAIAMPVPATLSDISEPVRCFDLGASSTIKEGLMSNQSTKVLDQTTYERQLGDSEVSYFLPSRANGVNDM